MTLCIHATEREGCICAVAVPKAPDTLHNTRGPMPKQPRKKAQRRHGRVLTLAQIAELANQEYERRGKL